MTPGTFLATTKVKWQAGANSLLAIQILCILFKRHTNSVCFIFSSILFWIILYGSTVSCTLNTDHKHIKQKRRKRNTKCYQKSKVGIDGLHMHHLFCSFLCYFGLWEQTLSFSQNNDYKTLHNPIKDIHFSTECNIAKII